MPTKNVLQSLGVGKIDIYAVVQGCAITVARRPGLLILEVRQAQIFTVLACQANKF